jgi:argininosuccinate lyase
MRRGDDELLTAEIEAIRDRLNRAGVTALADAAAIAADLDDVKTELRALATDRRSRDTSAHQAVEETLAPMYTAAIDELRSLGDPAVTGLIARLRRHTHTAAPPAP